MVSYEINVDEIVEKIKELNARSVGLQFPEGLKIHAVDVAREIEDKTGATVLIAGDPCYGACDVCDVQMSGMIDLLVHFGHTPLPLDYEVPVFFVEAYSKLDVMKTVEDALKFFNNHQKIGLVTTTQHLHHLDEIKDFLEDNGKEVIMEDGVGIRKGQLLGCNFSAVKNLEVDVFLYVGSGSFHALGIKLLTKKPVVIADPMDVVTDIDEFADRTLRIRFARITKAKEAQKFGILVSSKKGQLRLGVAKDLKNMIDKEGKHSVIIMLDDISPSLLTTFRDLDAFVVTACPRIAIDDSHMYKKPILTPQELQIVLGKRKWEDYKIDEIIIDT